MRNKITQDVVPNVSFHGASLDHILGQPPSATENGLVRAVIEKRDGETSPLPLSYF
ncbi:MAG: hypothetical protein H6Q41_4237 [Deltaproteobacteria bacterium]|nr:hypothetical protein [Deltaproteobacteria bacterium]